MCQYLSFQGAACPNVFDQKCSRILPRSGAASRKTLLQFLKNVVAVTAPVVTVPASPLPGSKYTN